MSLQSYIQKRIMVLTTDGNTMFGTLISCDQLTNLILQNTTIREIKTPGDPADSEARDEGTIMLRGDEVAVCGLVDEEADSQTNWAKVKGEPIRNTKND
ncbi:MAG: hypothetical protein M1820_000668 [Bogoriella megaspora]|nr:MAG: hypothetical protein M1820_000668 [Bogoriella megaspora]